MTKFALYVPLQAKPGKEKEVADFLRSAVPLVNAEPGKISWFAIQEGPSSFAIFDTFDDEAGRDAHLNGKVAAALEGKGKSRRPVCQDARDSTRDSCGQASKMRAVDATGDRQAAECPLRVKSTHRIAAR